MTDVTQILSEIEMAILPRLSDFCHLSTANFETRFRQTRENEKPGQTLPATALVHEAYLRLVDNENVRAWKQQWAFFRRRRRGHAANSG
jgi:hypothetical protein